MRPNTESTRRGKAHLDCAWCELEFARIVELLAHVDERHLAIPVVPLVARVG